jgi:hypothetical protein
MTAIVFDATSVNRLIGNLNALPKSVGRKHLRIALNAWGGVVKRVAVAKVRRRTSLLAKSLTVKVTIPAASFDPRHHDKPARVMVGPARNVMRPVHRGKAITEKRAANLRSRGTAVTRYAKPSRYAHLVEAIEPFIGPAQQTGATAGFEALRRKLQEGIEQEAAALAARP